MRILVLLSVFIFLGASTCSDQLETQYDSTLVQNPETKKTGSGLEYTITAAGNGPQAKTGDKVVVHYTVRSVDGKKIESSLDSGEPYSFVLGKSSVIKGWHEAFALLHAGDKATLRIPPELAYGSTDRSGIPANSTLIFEVELLGVIPAK